MTRCTVEDVIFLKISELVRTVSLTKSDMFDGLSSSMDLELLGAGTGDSVSKRLAGDADCPVIESSVRYIVSASSSNQSGLIRGKLSRILRNRS